MAFIKCFWKLNFYFQCLQKNIKIKKIYCPKRTFKNAWFGGPIWWTIFFVYRNIWLWSAPHFASHSVKQGCHRWLHKNKFERCEWVIHLRAEVKRMLSHAHTQTHTYTHIHTHSLWEASVGRRQGAEGWLEPYEQPAGIFSFHSNHIIHTTICFSCVKKCFYGIRID